jgi:hypothetical protein
VNWFYYGLINPCDAGTDGFAGVARRAIPERDNPDARVGWGVFRTGGRHAATFVHEIGHELGRRHVLCSGREANPDTNYPNSTGATDSWGWDVSTDDRILSPQRADFMSYCDPEWVSEYGWNLLFPTITRVSGWELENRHAAQVNVRRLTVFIYSDGTQEAWIGRGAPITNASPDHSIAFYEGSNLLAHSFASYSPIPESQSFQVTIELPADFAQATSAVLAHGMRSYPIDLSRVQVIR